MECKNYQKNLEICACSYPGCSKKGYCCECIAYHKAAGQLPGCLFTPEAERSYDRSIAKFISSNK